MARVNVRSLKRFNTEDLWAVGLGCLVLTVGLVGFVLPAWIEIGSEHAPPVVRPGLERVSSWLARPQRWQGNPLNAFLPAEGRSLFVSLGVLAAVLAALFGLAARALGFTFRRFAAGFVVCFSLAVFAFVLAAQDSVRALGIDSAAWAIALGLLVSNTVGAPRWLLEGAQTELFIKTGLVLLGAEVLVTKVLAIGLPGVFVAWVVTPIVLVTTFWFGQRVLRIGSKTLNITISADMSVCGVSAAIATAAACNAKKEELTVAIGLSMVFTSVMMVVLPLTVQALGIDPIVGGAWIGGTIDSTGAVAAAGAWLGDRALHVAATIKMIQNLLIGVVAFFVALYFARTENGGRHVGAGEIWRRFPKFVLGFIAASVLFSWIDAQLGPELGAALLSDGVIKHLSKPLRAWCFALAFVSIGLQTDFRQLRAQLRGGKPLALYACGQCLNLVLTLSMAYLMFRVVFAQISERI